jgi:hypothetical protein
VNKRAIIKKIIARLTDELEITLRCANHPASDWGRFFRVNLAGPISKSCRAKFYGVALIYKAFVPSVHGVSWAWPSAKVTLLPALGPLGLCRTVIKLCASDPAAGSHLPSSRNGVVPPGGISVGPVLHGSSTNRNLSVGRRIEE